MKFRIFLLGVLQINLLIVFAQSTPPLFEQLNPKDTRVLFKNALDESEGLNVLAYEYFYNGGGVAVGDINNDGLLDIFFTANMTNNQLFLNMGGLTFKDITSQACEALSGRKKSWKTGVTMADVNGDGWLDIYVCYSGKLPDDQRRNQLFINKGINAKGDVTFKEEAKLYGLDDQSYSTQAAFFDYDNDGDLDMFLLNHSVKKIDNMEFARLSNEIDELAGSKLYQNNQNYFTDVSKKAGIKQNPMTFGLGVAVADINKDGWLDIYVSNDYNEPDYLYINNGNGTFSNKAETALTHLSQFSMGLDIADFNNDGLPDIVTLDMLPEDNRRQKLLQLQENYESFELMQNQGLQKQYMRNMLHLNNGDGTFSEIGRLAGVSNTDWSWTPLFADFDNDGYKDLFVSNGYLRDYTNKDFLRYWGDYKLKKAIDREPALLMDLIRAMPSTLVPNYVFKNNQNLTFSNQQEAWGINTPVISSAAVYADLDNDGDLDLVVNNVNDYAFLYKNNSREQYNSAYLSIALRDKTANTLALGAKVYIYHQGVIQYQEVNSARGYLSAVPPVLHFGMGTASTADSIKIIWPDQTTELLRNIKVNQRLLLQHKDNTQKLVYTNPPTKSIFSKVNPLISYSNEALPLNDFKRQLLMLFMYSNTGPVIAKADVNKDGREDIFISGDLDKPGRLYIQQAGKQFTLNEGLSLGDESTSTTSAAAFFDCNGDGHVDLYVAKGGYAQWESGSAPLQDVLYINDGKGQFTLAPQALPDLSASSKSCVRPCDFDGDGDMDVFVGGRVFPGKYPMAPTSYLLVNNGKGVFSKAVIPFAHIGMVTDAQWADLNADGRKDLVICGEFMPITVFINTAEGFIDKTNDYFSGKTNGLWFTLKITDINGDGQDDIIAGNMGLNAPFRVSDKEPAQLYYADFDGNGSIDPFFNFYVQGKSYPFVSRDELNEQIYAMRKKFASYKQYADATIQDIFSAEELAKNPVLTLNELSTTCFLNQQGKFVKLALPMQAQFSIVSKILTGDFNKDGIIDLLLFGNKTDNRLKIGSIDAGYGCLLVGDGKNGFEYVNQTTAGLSVKGDVKSVETVLVDQEKYLVIGASGKVLVFYKVQ